MHMSPWSWATHLRLLKYRAELVTCTLRANRRRVTVSMLVTVRAMPPIAARTH